MLNEANMQLNRQANKIQNLSHMVLVYPTLLCQVYTSRLCYGNCIAGYWMHFLSQYCSILENTIDIRCFVVYFWVSLGNAYSNGIILYIQLQKAVCKQLQLQQISGLVQVSKDLAVTFVIGYYVTQQPGHQQLQTSLNIEYCGSLKSNASARKIDLSYSPIRCLISIRIYRNSFLRLKIITIFLVLSLRLQQHGQCVD